MVSDNDHERSVSIDRLYSDIEALGRIGCADSGGVSRTSFTPADTEARRWLAGRAEDAGLTYREDRVGNVFIRLEPSGDAADRPAVCAGSHIDSVPNGGRLDGALGVLAALECARRLAESPVRLCRPVQVMAFADEEGNYHHLLGSSALARGFHAEELSALRGRDGDLLADALAATGRDVEQVTRTMLDSSAVHAFLELHIEQGPKLEADGTDVGVVTSIVGLGGGQLDLVGRADHAGTTPMNARQDALHAAGDLLTRLPAVAASVSETAVVTCGLLDVEPGASNVVPGCVRLTLDFRDAERAQAQQLEDAIVGAARSVADAHGVRAAYTSEGIIDPVALDPGTQKRIEQAALDRGYTTTRIPSGAGHDAQNMATLTKTAMIFIPSKGGRSHCPDEDTAPADIERGANVLLDTITALAQQP